MAALLAAGMSEGHDKILCVEDDPETGRVIVEELRARGFDVTLVADPQDAFVAILKGDCDFVLCDVGLRGMSGLELLSRLKELRPRLKPQKPVPFVFLTALADRNHELQARRLGADDYVTKPIDFDILETIINARLAGVARNVVPPKLVALNDREIEVLTWVARGKTSAQISEILGISKRTVDFHTDNARMKLAAATRTEAATKAAVRNLIKV